MNATVLEMVKAYLVGLQFDGLYNTDGDCACKLEDLAPCGEMVEDCTAGYLEPCGPDCGEHDWHITDEKPKLEQMDAALACFKKLWKKSHGKMPSAAAVHVARRTFERLASEAPRTFERLAKG